MKTNNGIKKLSLPNVTLMAYVTGDHNRLYVDALRRTKSLIDFGQEVIFTDEPELFTGAKTFVIPAFTDYRLRSVWAMTELPKFDFFGDTTHLMGIHHDGFPLYTEKWQDKFLEYDYIGAAFANGIVGNNGFCMISKYFFEALNHLCIEPTTEACFPDDALMCVDVYVAHDGKILTGYRTRLENLGVKIAPKELADQFALHGQEYSGQFGFHGIETMRSIRAQGILEPEFLPEIASL